MTLSIVLSLSGEKDTETVLRRPGETSGREGRERERKSEVEEGERHRLFDCNDRDRRYRSTLSLRVAAS